MQMDAHTRVLPWLNQIIKAELFIVDKVEKTWLFVDSGLRLF